MFLLFLCVNGVFLEVSIVHESQGCMRLIGNKRDISRASQHWNAETADTMTEGE